MGNPAAALFPKLCVLKCTSTHEKDCPFNFATTLTKKQQNRKKVFTAQRVKNKPMATARKEDSKCYELTQKREDF